jgi:hypothetical protein
MTVPYKGTMLLGLAKLNLRSQGHTTTFGKRKPQKYQQATRTFFYNLGDAEHVRALLQTFRHLTAYAAAMKENRWDRRYCLNIGQRRVLTRSQLDLVNEAADVNYDGREILEILCENGNYRNPGHQVFAWDPEVRRAATERWRAQCSPRKRYTFKIRRTLGSGPGEMRGFTLDDASEVEIPLEAAEKVVEALQVVIQHLWSYLNRNPAQADRRYIGKQEKWQLHRLPVVDRLLMPRLSEAVTFHSEHALFFARELYDAQIPRFAGQGFHPLYLRRLEALDAGELRWCANWPMSEWQALQDVVTAQRGLAAQGLLKLRQVLRAAITILALKRRRRCRKQRKYTRKLRGRRPLEREERVERRSRGPPRRPP